MGKIDILIYHFHQAPGHIGGCNIDICGVSLPLREVDGRERRPALGSP